VILSYFPGRQERRGPRIQKRKPETLANSFWSISEDKSSQTVMWVTSQLGLYVPKQELSQHRQHGSTTSLEIQDGVVGLRLYLAPLRYLTKKKVAVILAKKKKQMWKTNWFLVVLGPRGGTGKKDTCTRVRWGLQEAVLSSFDFVHMDVVITPHPR
jgi:hypothetical protein